MIEIKEIECKFQEKECAYASEEKKNSHFISKLFI